MHARCTIPLVARIGRRCCRETAGHQFATRIPEQVGIDPLLASSKHGVAYLSDYWHPVSDECYVLSDVPATHKTFVGLPREEKREPFIVAGASEATTISVMDPWIKDRRYWGPGFYIQTWDDPLDPNPYPGDPMEIVAQALVERGLDRATIAIEERFVGGQVRQFRPTAPSKYSVG